MKQQKKVSAVVLAGGFGTRLSPVTNTKPKPLVKILDTTVLECILCAVQKAGVESITVSTHYQSEKIEKMCRESFPDVMCKRECVPLGTAGGVKFCSDGREDVLVVVSGDAVFDFSLKDAIQFHMKNDCDVTVVTSRKENPTEYGVVETDEENNIVAFCEKPPWKKVRSGLVNTGIYVLSQSVLASIPDNMSYDFSRNLFPKLMKEGKCIKSFTPTGFWCDIGTFDEYYECNVYAALGKLGCIPNNGVKAEMLRDRGVHAENGVYVSHNAIIGKNVKLSYGSIVCGETHVGDNCDIFSSVIGSGTRLGNGCSISGAIIGEGTTVGENCIIPEGCVIGSECRIADGSVLEKDERIAACSAVYGKDGKDLFSNKSNIFVDDGICTFEMSEAFKSIFRLSKAVLTAYSKSEKAGASVCVMCDRNAVHIKNAFVSGLQNGNASVFDCGTGSRAMCACAAAKLCTDTGVYFNIENEKVRVSFFDEKARAVDDADERKISKIFGMVNDLSQTNTDKEVLFSNPVNVPFSQMYTQFLSKFAQRLLSGSDLGKFSVYLSCKENSRNESLAALGRVLERMSAQIVNESEKETVNVSLNADGTRASVRYGNTILDHEHICAVILKNKEILGIEKMYVGENAPSVLKNMQDKNCNSESLDAENFIFSDGALAVAALLSAASLRNESLDTLYGEIPLFEIFEDEYIGDVNRGETAERLSRLYHDSKDDSGDGIRLSLADGNVTVIPGRAKGFKIISEAVSMEAARELSLKIGEIIKGKE